MSTFIKAKGFDAGLLTFLEPRHVIATNYVIPIRYDDCRLNVQLPRCTVCSSVYELAGKFYIDIMTPHDSVLMTFLTSIASEVKAHLKTLAAYQLHNSVYMDHVTRLTEGTQNDVFHSLRLKVPRLGQNFATNVTDAHDVRKIVTDLRVGSSVLCIVSIDNCYSMNGQAGVVLNATDVKIMDGVGRPSKPSE